MGVGRRVGDAALIAVEGRGITALPQEVKPRLFRGAEAGLVGVAQPQVVPDLMRQQREVLYADDARLVEARHHDKIIGAGGEAAPGCARLVPVSKHNEQLFVFLGDLVQRLLDVLPGRVLLPGHAVDVRIFVRLQRAVIGEFDAGHFEHPIGSLDPLPDLVGGDGRLPLAVVVHCPQRMDRDHIVL